jgi:quercetin dioxygenase-like cupin family protein
MPEKDRAMLPLIDVKEGLKLVLVALPKGGLVPPHQAPYPASLQLIQGHVEVLKGTTWLPAAPGERILFDPGETHAVKASESSYFLVSHLRGI